MYLSFIEKVPSKHISEKCGMVYRRSTSVTPQRRRSKRPQLIALEDVTDHEMPDLVPNNGPKSLKRSSPRNEEDLPLFRRVRMKIEVKTPAADAGDRYTKTRSNSDHPNHDPGNAREAETLRKKNIKLADALTKALEPPGVDKKQSIKFTDAVGRKFSFSFELCAIWAVSTVNPSPTGAYNTYLAIGNGGIHPASVSTAQGPPHRSYSGSRWGCRRN
jgi:hypothetical protein